MSFLFLLPIYLKLPKFMLYYRAKQLRQQTPYYIYIPNKHKTKIIVIGHTASSLENKAAILLQLFYWMYKIWGSCLKLLQLLCAKAKTSCTYWLNCYGCRSSHFQNVKPATLHKLYATDICYVEHRCKEKQVEEILHPYVASFAPAAVPNS